ncbi:helix-hairpin-helix domain-containing protein [Streptomyces sp. NPDC092903]|uniref:helix-hairpin-helix domain-containing protein n=1 Tax=Streptomyces sp. NPDC092903 TaxID=3366017 RepID=UPI0038275041
MASRSRADALMAGGYEGRVARHTAGVAPVPVPAAGVAGTSEVVDTASAVETASVADTASAVDAVSAAEVKAVEAATPEPPVGPAPRSEREGWWARAVPALRDRLPMWVQLRCGLEPRALAALTVVLVAAAVFAGMHFWSARPEGVRAPDSVSEAGHAAVPRADVDPAAGGAGVPEPSPAPPPAVGGTGGRIVVDVSGKVRRPGIHRLPSGARVTDALEAAGGVRPGVDLDGLNRARVLVDGEQILVGAPPGTVAGGAAGGAGPAATGPATGPVSLSGATPDQLETLPGVGPVLAQHIVDYRTQHGGFRSVDELHEVTGIGDRRFADLQPLVRP